MTNKAKWRQALEERNKALNLLGEVLSYVAQGVSIPKTLVEDCERLQQVVDNIKGGERAADTLTPI